jgi:Fe-S cluster biogenesis protein NfuA
MPIALEDQEFHRRLQRLEALLQQVEQLPDSQLRDQVKEIVQAILDLHGIGLERIFEQIARGDETHLALIETLARDELVGNLLLLHGLHPADLETRVRQALDKVRPYLGSHGGDVELLDVRDGIVRLRMMGSCQGCPSSSVTLKLAIEEAIYQAAPDVVAIEAEGTAAAAPGPGQSSGFVSVDRLYVQKGRNDGRAPEGEWDAMALPC